MKVFVLLVLFVTFYYATQFEHVANMVDGSGLKFGTL